MARIFISLIVCFAISSASLSAQDKNKQRSLVREFLEVMEKYHPTPIKGSHRLGSSKADFKEQKERFKCFCKTKKDIDRVNEDDSLPYHAGVNHFSMMTDKEWSLQVNGLNMSRVAKADAEDERIAIKRPLRVGSTPESIDWVTKGMVQGPILDQKQCPASWAFAAVSALEGAYKQVTGDYVSFSDQEIIDYASDFKLCGVQMAFLMTLSSTFTRSAVWPPVRVVDLKIELT